MGQAALQLHEARIQYMWRETSDMSTEDSSLPGDPGATAIRVEVQEHRAKRRRSSSMGDDVEAKRRLPNGEIEEEETRGGKGVVSEGQKEAIEWERERVVILDAGAQYGKVRGASAGAYTVRSCEPVCRVAGCR